MNYKHCFFETYKLFLGFLVQVSDDSLLAADSGCLYIDFSGVSPGQLSPGSSLLHRTCCGQNPGDMTEDFILSYCLHFRLKQNIINQITTWILTACLGTIKP